MAIVIPNQIQAAEHSAAIESYEDARDERRSAVDEYVKSSDALGERYELAAVQLDGFLHIIRLVPESMLDPVDSMGTFKSAVDEYRAIAKVTATEVDETVPAIANDTLKVSWSVPSAKGLTTEEIRRLSSVIRDDRNEYRTATAANAEQVSQIDAAYDHAVTMLDGVMTAGRTWGDRDVYEKDTPEQTAALIAAAQALVKPESESFTDLTDRTAALEAFVAAHTDAKAGQEQALAAEEAARQQAAAEAERQAAAERRNSSSGGGNPSSPRSGGGQPPKNTNGSGGGIPPGGGRPGGGTNGTNGGCWTSNGAGGTMPCGGW